MDNETKYQTVIKSMDEYTYDWNPDWAEDPSQPILKITKSSLGSHDWCPKKYGFSSNENSNSEIQFLKNTKMNITRNHGVGQVPG